jgi:sugar phosphate permease
LAWAAKLHRGLGRRNRIYFAFRIGQHAASIYHRPLVGNRLTQSIGWAGLVRVCSKFFGYSSYGTIMGVLSLSFLIGDAVARESMGVLLRHGCGWRALFYFAAGVSRLHTRCELAFSA